MRRSRFFGRQAALLNRTRPKRAKSRDKTAGSLFTRAYTLVKSVKLKGVSSRFDNKTYKDK